MRGPAKSQSLLRPETIERLALDFEIGFYEAVLGLDPEHVDALETLGNAYTRKGRVEDGLRVDQKLVSLLPDSPVAHYNLACSYSLLDDADRALGSLERAIRLGYKDFKHLERDPDLEKLRKDRRFAALIKRYA